MNVLLVNAPSNGIYYKMGLKLPPLGVAYLAAYLRKNGKYSVLTPFPGTALYKQAEDENLIATRDWSIYDGAHAVMNTHYMTQKEIIWSVIKAYLSFYGQPSRWWEVPSGAGTKRCRVSGDRAAPPLSEDAHDKIVDNRSVWLIERKSRSQVRIWLGRTYHTILRYRQWYLSSVSYSSRHENKDNYPYIIFNHETPLIRNLKGADMWLQYNKIINLKLAVQKLNGAVIHPGQTFSYWKYTGRPTAKKGYVEGMVLYNGQVRSGIGGGLCQISNLIYWMTLHTPLTIVERWRHSYDVFPDDNRTQPFGSGATCAYPRLDLQIKNDTAQSFILALSVTDTHLCGQWRSTSPIPYHYEIYEGKHWITHEPLGQYVRHNIIYRRTFDENDNILNDRPIVQNHAIMMYQPFLSEPRT